MRGFNHRAQIAMLTACLLAFLLTADPAAPIEFRVLSTDGTTVEFVGAFTAGQLNRLPAGDLNSEIAERWMRVTLVDEATGKDGTAILGAYIKRKDGKLSFRPRFPLSAGGLYRASLQFTLNKFETRDYRVPASAKAAAPRVTAIYPTADRVPANLLKFYIHFSQPMREGEAVFDNCQLLNDKNQPLVDCWRLTELWNHDATRLTMFIHPGRIKEGVNLREEEGPVLVPNRRYTLVIGGKTLDAKGQPLGLAFTKQFTTTAEDHERIDISRWSLRPPESNSRSPLRLELPKALDRHLLARCLRVNDAQGKQLEGAVEVLEGERAWQFTPVIPWRAEKYTVDIDGVLEDQAGNTPLRRFDNELKDKDQEASEAVVPLKLVFQPLPSAARADAVQDDAIPLVGRYIAVDNVCAWPNLKVLRDGTIVATIFGQPSHGRLEGDVECWASSDGQFWEKRGIAARHEASANRMNVAAGFDREGNLLVLSSGWSLKREGSEFVLGEILPAWSCRSPDARTWTVRKNALPPPSQDATNYIPFGDIFVAADGSLRTSCYARVNVLEGSKPKGQHRSWVFRSDDGKQWNLGSVIGPVHNETTLFHLGGNKWLAAARSEYVELFRSDDDCATWQSLGPVTQRNEINAHLQRLQDGRLLLSYGRRIAGRFGVAARLSSDEGKTWGKPMTIVDDLLTRDCGYPSSVQRADGTIVTAYYASGVASHQRYHMGVALWNLPTNKKAE